MGLDTTHGAWHGAYSAFMSWRIEICKTAGYGNLRDYEGFDGTNSFAAVTDKGLRLLLNHSDRDGHFTATQCKKVADSLTTLLPKLNGHYGGHIGDIKEKTNTFINGCLLAYSKKQKLIFL